MRGWSCLSDLRPDVGSAIGRWRREASEELRAAEIVADHDDLPARVASFHAHLAAEKAIKSLLLRRAVTMPRMHDLLAGGGAAAQPRRRTSSVSQDRSS